MPYLLIVGEKEMETGTVSVRKQGEGDQGTEEIGIFANRILQLVDQQMNAWKYEQEEKEVK